MKRSIIAYPDQEFSIGPGKSLTCREKYKDRTEKFSAISCRTGDCRLQPVSEGFCIHRGKQFTNSGSCFKKRPYKTPGVAKYTTDAQRGHHIAGDVGYEFGFQRRK